MNISSAEKLKKIKKSLTVKTTPLKGVEPANTETVTALEPEQVNEMTDYEEIMEMNKKGFSEDFITQYLKNKKKPNIGKNRPLNVTTGNFFATRISRVEDTGLLSILCEIDPQGEGIRHQIIESFRLVLTERLQLQLYTSKFTDEFLEKILLMKDIDAQFMTSLPSTLHAMFAEGYIDKVNQPIKALCEILKISASKQIAAAVETLWQTIVRLANENISDKDLLEIFANQFQCLIAQALDIIRHTPDQRNIFLILIDEANLSENHDPIIKHLKHIQSQSDRVASKGSADAILQLQQAVERLTQQITHLSVNRPGSRPLNSSTKQTVCFKFVTGKCPNAVCPGGFLHAYPEGTSDIEKTQHMEKAKLFIAGTLYPKKRIQKST